MSSERHATMAQAAGDALSGRVKERRFALVLIAGLTVFFIASAFVTPSEVQPDGSYYTICSLKRLTGLPCPGCGLAHSFCALGRGRLAEGFAFNLLGPPLYLCAMLLWLRSAFFLLRWDGPAAFFDGLAERLQPVKLFLIAFLIFGAGRILFLLIDKPSLLTEGALYRALARATGL